MWLFFILACLILGFSVVVVTAKNLMHAAVALIVSFFATAILYLLLKAEFVAIAQVLVYIGGVVIFMVFTILLTSRLGEQCLAPSKGKQCLSAIVCLGIFYAFYRVLGNGELYLFHTESKILGSDSMSEIGLRLLSSEPSGFIFPFEVISLLLLAVIIGASVIARKKEGGSP